jgi:pimeloyl-ACP methyl ester carboxylesterase
LPDPTGLGEPVTAADDLSGDGPYLIFLHGTASTTTGSFGGLAGTSECSALRARYGRRILALEHRTLSLSPVQNALDLATLLPAGAKLHLVSHSRGGLVGELFCLRTLTEPDLHPFAKSGRDRDAEALWRLSGLLAKKGFQIERFVRVACPARGSRLASRRLDLYLSVLLNLIGFIPALHENPIYAFVKATLLELAGAPHQAR